MLRLASGTAIVLRPIRPSDKALLVRGLEQLSDRSTYYRFLSPKPRLTAAELRYLTEVDQVDHYAIVAVHADDPGRPAGVGRWVRSTEDPESAEMAIVVADELQGQGLGTGLGMTLVDAARTRGIRRFTATMLPENVAARRLLAHLSERLDWELEGGLFELTAELAA